jgi:geranylgeranyl reductase family protein
VTVVQPDYDVIIIGAGPAGSTAAKCLMDYRPETRVLLLDKAHKFPRPKPCGGYFGAEVLELFPYLKGNEGKFVESESNEGILHSPDLRYQVGGHTRMFGVLRPSFDAYLVGLAQQAGVKIGTRSRVIDVKPSPEQVFVELEDGRKLSARIIVGADGAASVVARRSGLHQGWQSHEVCRTLVKEFHVDPNYILDHYGTNRSIHLFLQFNQIPGYAWVFPKAHHINVGLGCFANHPIRLIDYFRLLVRLLKQKEMLPESTDTKGVEAGICPTAGPLPITQSDRVMLIGDAAGFVYPLTGAGIVPGMQSGQLAAKTLAEASDRAQFDSTFLERYQFRWEKVIGRFKTELLVQRAFLTRWCNLFIRIGERDAGMVKFITNTQTTGPTGTYGPKINVLELLLRLVWALIKGPFGRL